MAQLDELSTEGVREEGLDTHVIAKKVPVTVGFGSKLFEVILWVLLIIPGVVFLYRKQKARDYFNQLEQKIQANASTVDNYLEQRVVVLRNCARLLDKAIDLDKDVFTKVAAYRSGSAANEEERNAIAGQIDNIANSVNVAFEKYPDLQAHKEIQDGMQQNLYLQREITAARELYNDSVNKWNRDIFEWPAKRIVAAKEGYTTRIPFIASKEIREAAREVFF